MKKLILFSLLCILLFPLCSFAANDGTPFGSVTFGSPKFGTASLSFDGTDSGVTVSDSASLNFGSGDFTIEGWINTPDTGGGGGQQIIAKGSGSQGYYEIGTYGNVIGSLYFYGVSAPSGADVWVESTINISNGAWHHIEIVRRGTTIELWIDNSLNASDSNPSLGSFVNSYDVIIGNGPARGFNGLIDEFVLYNVALSPETIASHYNSTNYQADVSNTPGLVTFWRFDNDYLDAPVSSVPLTDSELLQQIKDVLDQIDAKAQAIKDVTSGSAAVDWNKTMSFGIGALASIALVMAVKSI